NESKSHHPAIHNRRRQDQQPRHPIPHRPGRFSIHRNSSTKWAAKTPRKEKRPRRGTKKHEWEEGMDFSFFRLVPLRVPSWAIPFLAPRRLGGAFSLSVAGDDSHSA